jgi:acetyltransferase-like isoleucine patch superfamily enzyme
MLLDATLDIDQSENIELFGYNHLSAPIILDDNVWIGAGSIILPNVRIGKNSVVGAGSVVTKDVAAYSVVAGNPAKLIRMLN